jgi:hypothetical protein
VFEIGPEALRALHSQSEHDFAVKLARTLHDTVPELASETPGSLVATVKTLVARARTYGLTTERSIAVYALTAAYVGIDFDTAFDPASAVLSARDMSEDQKTMWLEDWTTQLFEELA